jgi:hypothetical protein
MPRVSPSFPLLPGIGAGLFAFPLSGGCRATAVAAPKKPVASYSVAGAVRPALVAKSCGFGLVCFSTGVSKVQLAI